MGLAAEVRGEGRPVVLLPWFGLDRRVMVAAMEPVFEVTTGWRRIYADLPGTGESAAVAPASDAVLEEVLGLIDRESGGVAPLLAGCSYGGYIAAGVARRRPDWVAGLLLVCSGVKIRPEDRDVPPATEAPEPDDWLTEVPPGLHDHFLLAIGNRTRGVADRIAGIHASAGPRDEDYLARLRTQGYQLSDEGSPVPYDGPASLISGRLDRVTGYADQFRTLAAYPQASYAVLANAGHYLPFEQPGAFRRLTLDWLARCLPERI